MRDKFPGKPGDELPLEGIPDVESAHVRFDPKQHRAFGSVPKLLGEDLDIPDFERLDTRAWTLTDATTMRQGLYHPSGTFVVNGVSLSPEYYEQIIRSQRAFLAKTGGATIAANRLANPELAVERFEKSQTKPLEAKHARHETIITGLQQQQKTLDTLLEWQRQPGYWRTSESELRILATSAWDQVLVGMLGVLKDNHGLDADEFLDMQHALGYRLFRDSQRISQWGEQLALGRDYTRSVRLLFQQSDAKILRQLESKA